MKRRSTASVPSRVTVGNTVIDLLVRNGRFLGLGKIAVNGVMIRSAAVPLRPEIQTPDGIRYDSFRLRKVYADCKEVVLVTTAIGTQSLYGEYRDEYDNPLAWPNAAQSPILDTVEWRLRPEALDLDGVAYQGFSYALRFRSSHRSIHSMTLVGTWELGGRAIGNTLLYQGQVNPPVYACKKATAFTTACWRSLGHIGRPEDYSFQFSPRYSPLQCFDFQYGPAGTLFGYWPDLVNVHSLVQKNRGEDVVFVLDKCLVPLAKDAAFPRKCILWAPPTEGENEHLMHDRWLRALEYAQGRARATFKVQTPYVLPETKLLYRPGLDSKGKLVMHVAGKPYAPQDTLAAWAEHFPALKAAGVRRIFPDPVSESDVTERGYDYKLQRGIHGDLQLGSVCNTWCYRPAEFWGGWKSWEAFYHAGHAAGIEIGHWVGSHLSQHAPALRQHPEFICQAANTRPHAGGYTINLAWGLNWNAACDWLLEQFAEWKRHGLDYVFFDSIGNGGFLGVDFKARMQPNATGLARFIGGLNQMGIKAITVEGISPFGMGYVGATDNMTEKKRASDAVAGQIDLSWWIGHEDMLAGNILAFQPHPQRDRQEVEGMLFRILANRSLPLSGDSSFGWGDADKWPAHLANMAYYYQTFNQVEPFMRHRRLLPGRRGVEWSGEGGRVLFAYKAFNYALPHGSRVEHIMGNNAESVAAAAYLRTEPYTTYRIV